MAKMYRVYSIIERPKQEDFWLNIGVAYPHEKGHGFNVVKRRRRVDQDRRVATHQVVRSQRQGWRRAAQRSAGRLGAGARRRWVIIGRRSTVGKRGALQWSSPPSTAS